MTHRIRPGSRTTVLDRIRSALTDVPTAEQYDAGRIARTYRSSHAEGDLVDLFADVAADYRATVTRTDDPRAAIATALLDRGVAGALLVPEGFPTAWLPEGDWTRRIDTPALDVHELNTASGVLTTCALAIATTGTIVLDAGPGQGRRVLTLLPDYHLCVVRSGQIAGDVPEAVQRLVPHRPLTLISGPSATSDIELERVEGVHGPRTLDIVIVDE
ncbi:LutC/YkgG family protein [Streptomyces coerulescens]|uniref:Lactate utilization protein C n=1 Tax=Streptomyces coerulescens TaxID=29304 RepID=A0ABW0CZ67_STRCD